MGKSVFFCSCWIFALSNVLCINVVFCYLLAPSGQPVLTHRLSSRHYTKYTICITSKWNVCATTLIHDVENMINVQPIIINQTTFSYTLKWKIVLLLWDLWPMKMWNVISSMTYPTEPKNWQSIRWIDNKMNLATV